MRIVLCYSLNNSSRQSLRHMRRPNFLRLLNIENYRPIPTGCVTDAMCLPYLSLSFTNAAHNLKERRLVLFICQVLLIQMLCWSCPKFREKKYDQHFPKRQRCNVIYCYGDYFIASFNVSFFNCIFIANERPFNFFNQKSNIRSYDVVIKERFIEGVHFCIFILLQREIMTLTNM